MKKIKQLIAITLIVCIDILLFSSCSTNHESKLINCVWALKDANFAGNYLWKFDGKGRMLNLNHTAESIGSDAFSEYKIDGGKIILTHNNETKEFSISYPEDNRLSFTKGEEKMEFHKADSRDSLVGKWENSNEKERSGKLVALSFSPDGDCDFSIDGGREVFGNALFRGTFLILDNTIELSGKEVAWKNSEKTYNGKIKYIILSLDSIQIKQEDDEMIFTRDKYKN